MTTTFAEAATASTVDEVRDDLLASLVAENATVNGWSDGAPQRAFLEGEARAIAAETSIRADLAATASPTTCTQAGSTWVDAVMGFFDVENSDGSKGRLPATQAIWDVPLKITVATGSLTITNQSVIQLQAADGTIFLCSQPSGHDVVINAGSSYRGVARFTARQPGTTGNVPIGQITKVISGPAGLSVDLNNASSQTRVVTARDVEKDQDFIRRGLGKWSRLGAGWTRTAFDYLIPFYGNTSGTSVTRWSVDDANPDGPGTVHVWVADAAGPASAATVTAVDNGLNGIDVKPVGSGDLAVDAASTHAITINVTLTVDGSNPTVGAQAQTALTALGNAFPLGPATLEPDLVSAVARGAPIASASIVIGSTTQVISLDLPGFPSVVEVTSLDLTVPENVSVGQVLVLTINVTVENA